MSDRSAQPRNWNTRNLAARLGSDATAAISAGALVAPVICSIDKAIIENASGRNTLGRSLLGSLRQFVFRPHQFVFSKPFGLILMLYSGTYTTANVLDTTSSTISNKPATSITAGPSKFFATSSANLSLCLYKDRHFTQLFGSVSSAARPVPLPTYALFTLRDCLTIFASFNVPPLLAPRLPTSKELPSVLPKMSQASMAQFLAPAGVQLISTPMHLLGLDLYNRPGSVSWQERMQKVVGEWGKSSLARMGRIIPAFGVGGVVNARVRRNLMEKLE